MVATQCYPASANIRFRNTLHGPIEAVSVCNTLQIPSSARPRRLSLTQTYNVASTARAKLCHAASQGDHNLRLLVGHANLIDELMIELVDAERQQEARYNRSLRVSPCAIERKHVQWMDDIPEEDINTAADSDDDSVYDQEEEDFVGVPLRKVTSPSIMFRSSELDDDKIESDAADDQERNGYNALDCTLFKDSSPDLEYDSDSVSEDEPVSPLAVQGTFDVIFEWARTTSFSAVEPPSST